ncbi:MAG: NAD(P)-dependent alcohol dehydrogenase [Chitinophagaceae bacterium]|nr:NAD(P)-dependent alcohol dehydrogenase [Chitinophagaceae bacterium]MCW5929712.1 NAD(P)-dependent alcohol dehydrogenase [Chitinophagaceae bacterium]
MKAVIFKKFGNPEVLQLAEIEKPIPKNNEVLVKIYATSVTAEDPKMRSFNHSPLLKLPVGLMYGFKKPKKPVLGMEFSGIVESVGNKVKNYKSGDRIFGYTGVGFGAYAEYKCFPENSIMYSKPENLSFEQSASMVNGFLTVLAYLKKKGKVEKGDRVLIYGASGSVGTAAVQLAKHLGATVTGVCSTRNVELVKSIGADYVIDYTKENFADRNETYDVIFDTIGKTSMKGCMNLLSPKGKYLLTEFGISHILTALYTSLFRSKKVIVTASNMYWKREDLTLLKELAENGHFKPVLDRSFRLDEIVEAHKYVETGRKVGNVAVSVR